MAARQNNGNIRQYRKPFNINLGTFIFFLIFVYIIICVGIYLFRDQKVVAYRVQEGALSVDNIYTAIALRDETVVTSSYNGYINYYAREGERVGANQLVCTVDERSDQGNLRRAERGQHFPVRKRYARAAHQYFWLLREFFPA